MPVIGTCTFCATAVNDRRAFVTASGALTHAECVPGYIAPPRLTTRQQDTALVAEWRANRQEVRAQNAALVARNRAASQAEEPAPPLLSDGTVAAP